MANNVTFREKLYTPIFQQLSAITAMPSRNKAELDAKSKAGTNVLRTLPVAQDAAFKALPTKEKRLVELLARIALSFPIEASMGLGNMDAEVEHMKADLLKVKSLETVPLIKATALLLALRMNELSGRSFLVASALREEEAKRRNVQEAKNAAEREAKRQRARQLAAIKLMFDDYAKKGWSTENARQEILKLEQNYMCSKAVYDQQRAVFAKNKDFEQWLLKDGRINELIYAEPVAPWAKYMK